MNAQDRLAATLAKHQRFGHTYSCSCGWEWPEEPTWACGEEDRFERDLVAHQAAVIASADDLAVIELPEPEVDRVGCKGWAEFQVYCAPGSDKVRIAPEDHRQPIDAAREIAAGILAAAKAVSDQ